MRTEIQGRREWRTIRFKGLLSFLLFILLYSPLNVCVSTALAQSGRKIQGQQGQQGQNGQQPGEKPMVRIETREVAFPIIAYDADGKYINDLQVKDVLVMEDGESRQVTNLKRDSANIVLIMDLDNEIGTFKNGASQRFGKPDSPIWEKGENYKVVNSPTQWEFANQFISNLSSSDKIAIIQYAEKAQLIQDWTSDPKQAVKAIGSKYRVGLKSSYYDALKLAADKLQSCSDGRRIVVLITDGLDSNSQTGRSKAIEALEASRATVFVIGWAEALRHEVELSIEWIASNESSNTNTNKRIAELRHYIADIEGATSELRVLAEDSGGELLLPPSHDELIKSNKNVKAEIGAQYTLSFLTENAPSLDDKREIDVVPARPGVILRSRHSYQLGAEDEKNRGND